MFELTVRIAFSLLVVLGIMWGLAKVARRPLGVRRAGVLAVLGRQQLSKGASVAIVRVADRALVLGVTDGQVNLLGEVDPAMIEEYRPEPAVQRTPVSLESLTAAPAVPTSNGALAGSVLSAQTWSQTLRVLRAARGPQLARTRRAARGASEASPAVASQLHREREERAERAPQSRAATGTVAGQLLGERTVRTP